MRKPAPPVATHVDDRHGNQYPLPPRSGVKGLWTGWLTHQEFDLIEMYTRLGQTNIYAYGERMGFTTSYAQTIYFKMLRTGVFMEGSTYEEYKISPMALILFNMTDQYLIQVEIEDEDSEDVA